jgi:hypothetical protein
VPVHARLAPASLALVLLASAGPASAAPDQPPQQKVANVVPFDLAVCFLQPVTVDKPVNEFALSGLWATSRPLVLDCLADTRFYVPGKSPAFKLTLAVSETGYSRTVETDGLTPAGKKCVEDAVGKVSPTIDPLPAGSKPVTYVAQVPELPPREQVRFGINEASDVAGTVRLSLPSLCSCFEPYRTLPDPAPVDIRVQVTRVPDKFKFPDGGMPRPVEVTVNDGPPPAVKSCLNEKLSALKYPTTVDQLLVPYRFLFLDALAPSDDVSALPDALKFAQLDAMSGQKAAATQLQLARQVSASTRYNEKVKQYQTLAKSKDKADQKKATAMVKELSTACKELVKQDEVYISTVESEAKLQQDMLTLASSLKAKDPVWTDAEAATQKATASTNTLLAKAKELRATDEKACPKLKY